MTRDDALSILAGLRERFNLPYSPADKEQIQELYLAVLGKVFIPTSCQNCYHDAVVEMSYHLKRNGEMAQKKKFMLKAGAIIQCPDINNGEVYSNANLTDDVAKEYLRRYPERVFLFAKYEKAALSKKKTAAKELQGKAEKTTQSGQETAKIEE